MESKEQLFADCKKWVQFNVMDYLCRSQELKRVEDKMKAVVAAKGSMTVEDCFAILSKKWFRTTYLPFMSHPALSQQNTAYHCGFHALYNTICFLHVLLSKDPYKQLKYAHRLFSKFSFWLFYKRTLASVAEELKATGKTSDLANLLNDGPLERYEMQHLIDTHHKVSKLFHVFSDSYLKFTRIFFSFSHFQMASPQELVEVQDTFDDFLGSPKDGALVVFLGVITHWVVVVVHKVKGVCKMYLLDSLVHEYMHVPDELIGQNAQDFYDARCRVKGKQVVPYRVKMFTQLLTDLRILYRIIYKMVMKQENLKQLHVNTEIKIFWEEYEAVLETLFKELSIPCSKESQLVSLKALKQLLLTDIPADKKGVLGMTLYKWLISHKPKSLRDGVMTELQVVGAKHMSEEWKQLVSVWWDVQTLILEKVPVPVLSETVDPDNLPKKVFSDYLDFLNDFQKILTKC